MINKHIQFNVFGMKEETGSSLICAYLCSDELYLSVESILVIDIGKRKSNGVDICNDAMFYDCFYQY